MKWPEVCCFMLLICYASSDLYPLNVDKEQLLQTEMSFIQIFHSFIQKFEQRIVELKRQVEIKEQEHKKVVEDRNNPLNSFILIKRLLIEWDVMLKYLSDDISQEARQNITEVKSSQNFPTNQDLEDAVENINRISDVFNVDKTSIANGKVFGTQHSSQLSAADCYEMVKKSHALNQYHHVYSWANEALKRFDKEGNIKDSVLEKLLELKGYSAYILDDISTAFNTTKELLKLFPNNPRAPASMKYYTYLLNFKTDKDGKPTKMKNAVDKWKQRIREDELNRKVCREEITPPVEITSQLKCRYVNNDIPFLRLAPLKQEEAYLDPRIVIYKDVLYDSEIEVLKEMTIPKLEVASVTPFKEKKNIVAKERIAKQTWFSDDEHPVIRTIVQRTEDMSKMVPATHVDPLHVANYTIGGFFEPHWDYFKSTNSTVFDSEVGDRIATLILYMNDVEKGGQTGFPLLHFAVKPEKGSAALWFNLAPDSRGILKTLHGSCPVQAGNKLVAIKWFRDKGQEFRIPCEKKQ